MRSPYRCGEDDVARMGRQVRDLAARRIVDARLESSYETAFADKVTRILASSSPDVPVLQSWIRRLNASEQNYREIVEALTAGLQCARQLSRVRRILSNRQRAGMAVTVASVSTNPALASMVRRAQALMRRYLREIVDIPIPPGTTWHTELLGAFVNQLGKRGGSVSHRSMVKLIGGIATRVRATQDALVVYGGTIERHHAEAMRGYVAAVERAA